MPNSNFISAIEVWVPTADRTKLTLKSGHYGELEYFARISRGMQFAWDEGLPGKCWAQGRPMVLSNLGNSYFRRGDAAMTEGIDCAVAIPTFAGPDLKAVLVAFCGNDGKRIGALELWHAAPGESLLTLDDGYFGAAEKFEFTSRHTQFARKVGLPGMVWDSGLPLIMDDLGRGNQFIRAGSAEKVGINRGVGFPCPVREDADNWVIAMLSARNSPIARRIELWMPDMASGLFRYVSGYCESEADLAAINAGKALPLDSGPLGEARITGVPVIAEVSAFPALANDAPVADAKLLVMPVYAEGVFAAALVAYL